MSSRNQASFVGTPVVLLGFLVLVATGAFVGGRSWSVSHVARWTGRADLGFVGCSHCHGKSIADMQWARPRPRHSSPAALATSRDGAKLYVACDQTGEILECDSRRRVVERRLKVDGAPSALAVNASNTVLYATCRDADRVISVDLTTFAVASAVDVGAGPVAIAFIATDAGDRLVVANSVSDDISVLDVPPLRELARPKAGREPYAVTASADGAVACIANRLATTENVLSIPQSELTAIDPRTGKVLSRIALKSVHLAESAATVSQRDWCLVPVIKVRNLVPITQVASGWVMSGGLVIVARDGSVSQLPLDNAHRYFADPSAIAVDPSGKRAYIASAGGDVVSVIDLEKVATWLGRADARAKANAINDLSLAADYVVARIPTGRNPRRLALTPDGRTLFVAERLDDTILAIDLNTLAVAGRIKLGDGGADDPIRRGERIFTTAAHTFQGQFSCRSCHPDGHVDGLAYDFDGDGIGDNLLDNRSLQGLAGTEPFKWNGKNPDLIVQCGVRFARVLMRSDPIPEKDLRDLAAFIHSQPPPRWNRRRNQPLTAQQERGRNLFFATARPDGAVIPRERRCHTCHRPPLFTNRLPSDVATRGPRDTSDMFDTPHLLGIAYTAPYLHDGRARSLEELWTIYQTNDMHGVSSYMTKHQLNDLVEFLKTL